MFLIATPPKTESSNVRQLADGWFEFTESNQWMPSLIALVGLGVIAYLLAPAVDTGSPVGQGKVVDTIATVTQSESLTGLVANLREIYHQWVPSEGRKWAWAIYGGGALYVVLPFLWLLEWLFPVHRSQPVIGKGLLQDFVWFLTLIPLNILLLSGVVQALGGFYHAHLGFLTIESATTWPASLQVLTALFVGEFLNWFSHFCRHKLPGAWAFHAVHHSQREMNVFTDDRGHVVDRLVSELVIFIPFLVFQVPDLYAVAVIVFYRAIHSRLLHANVKINFGWLGWLLVSPQFHRVHHSKDPAHADKNYGVVLSIFDHLFGTAYPSQDVYPETGIDDPQFPIEDRLSVWQMPANWIRQTIFPFQQLLGRLRVL